MGKLTAYLRLARIDHGAIAAIATAVGCAVGAGGWLSIPSAAVIAILVTVLVEVGLFALNDVFNLEEDRVNAPDRPLVRGEVSVDEAVRLGVASLASGVIISAILGPAPLLVVALATASGMAYNAWLKRTGLPGNVVVALDTSLPFLFGATVVRGFDVPPLAAVFVLIAFTATLGREVLKGIRDLEGDLRAGVRTLAATRGVRAASLVAAVLLLTAPLLSLAALPLIYDDLKCALYTGLVAATDFLFAYSGASILLEPSREVAESGRRLTLLGMLLGTLAFASAA